jgi:asparagine synthetase B (glutamine-hydrolysing)
MCRVGLIINSTIDIAQLLAEQYANGANHEPTIRQFSSSCIVHCRFDVTSAGASNSDFPLENERYILNYNGEVYGFGESQFTETKFPTDVHYALDLIDKHGIDGFLAHVDFQGTIQIIDKCNNIGYVVVDQLNTAGGFWATFQNSLFIGQEVAVLHKLLSKVEAPPEIPINIIKNGHFLKINLQTGEYKHIQYRSSAATAWSGTDNGKPAFVKLAQRLSDTLYHACKVRINKSGLVGVMCSGGIDSSVVLLNTVNYLASVDRLADLRVFTFDQSGNKAASADLVACCRLLDDLGLCQRKYLTVIPEQDEIRAYLYENFVFSAESRLVTPNPVLNTQIRHTVRMSQVLAYIATKFPAMKCIISGDGADEVFAGYNSMRENVDSSEQLVENIRNKLADFPLNDAARVSLSSYFGTVAALQRSTVSTSTTIHPMEVRMPFTSHLVIDLLKDASPDFIVGNLNGDIVSKLLLRVAGQLSGLPDFICSRKKLAFNEGGGAAANSDDDPLEREISKLKVHSISKLVDDRKLQNAIKQLSIVKDDYCSDYSQQEVAVYFALNNGLSRLLLGNSFRSTMPDTIYSSSETGNEYFPTNMINVGVEEHSV